MKTILLFTVFCVCVYSSYAERVTTLGNCDEFSVVGSNRIYNPAKNNSIRRKVIKFPKVRSTTRKQKKNCFFIGANFQGIRESEFIIRGFKHYDYEQVPSNVTIVDGEFGEGRIWIKIESQKGFAIKSIFEFCGEKKL